MNFKNNFNNFNNKQHNSGDKLNSDFSANSLEVNNTISDNSNKEENSLLNVVGECLTFAPLLYERFTGQKLPAMGGTLGDIQTALQQINSSLARVISNQEQIYQKINSLEANASTGFLSLDKRIDSLQSIRLTHEKKQIDFNNRSDLVSTN